MSAPAINPASFVQCFFLFKLPFPIPMFLIMKKMMVCLQEDDEDDSGRMVEQQGVTMKKEMCVEKF
jgi:hypothetical protein